MGQHAARHKQILELSICSRLSTLMWFPDAPPPSPCGLRHSPIFPSLPKSQYGDDRVENLKAVLDHLESATHVNGHELVQQLLHKRERSVAGNTPTHLACAYGSHECLIELMSRGANTEMTLYSDSGLLHNITTSAHAQVGMAMYILENIRGIDINRQTRAHKFSWSYTMLTKVCRGFVVGRGGG